MLPKLSPCRICSKVPVRTVVTTTRAPPSAAYTDPSRIQDPSCSNTPQDLTRNEKDVLDSALRVDQAGELAANYIYMGQLAVLGRDKATGPLIQVRSLLEHQLSVNSRYSPGNVGSREETFDSHEQIAVAASFPADRPLGSRQGRRVRTRSSHRDDEQGSCHGMHRGGRDGDRRTLRRVSGSTLHAY